VMGQSNLAAGATIGSNHNSRANDNEVQAGRGFWPGLCTSIKHSCRFASFVLLAKGDYPCELDIPLPFALLNNDVARDRLEVMPAYWWQHNMYALARNAWKFQNRDKRHQKSQHIEFDSLAPDTAEEMLSALRLLEIWTGRAALKKAGKGSAGQPDEAAAAKGRELLMDSPQATSQLEVPGEHLEKSKRKALILRPYEGYQAYRQMLSYYAVKNLIGWMEAHPQADFAALRNALQGPRRTRWINVGGQLMLEEDVNQLRADIGEGKLDSWETIHGRYDRLWESYPLEKQKHAFATLCVLYGQSNLTKDQWTDALQKAASIQELIRDRVYESRKKDFENPFRQATFRCPEEMQAALGTIEDNDFVKQVREDTDRFKKAVCEITQRG